jgi:TetR/AcrR family transcriptional repressor of bet genes
MSLADKVLEIPYGEGRDLLRRRNRERRLIEATLDCIATLGLRETTVQDIAARAQMAVGSISQYFEGKEALYTAALDAIASEFAARVAERLLAAGTSPAERLRGYVDAYFDATTGQRRKVAVWFAFWGEVRAQPQYRLVCEEHDRAHEATVQGLVRDLLADAGLELAQAPALAKLVMSTCYGLWLELLTGNPKPSRASLHQLAYRQLTALFPTHAAYFTLPVE